MADDRRDLLRQVPLFAELDRRELRRVESSLHERTFSAGETVLSEGMAGVGFFVIVDGQAHVTVHGEERGTLGPGDHFGEIALITGTERTATIVADTDLRCLGMTSWEFRPLVEENASVAWKLLQALARKLPRPEERAA